MVLLIFFPGTEHARVVKDLGNCRSTDSGSVDSNFTCPPGRVVVYDVFAGVGPFAIPAARRGCRVFANDLNPSSFEWLMRNIKENSSSKRRLDNVTCYNLDGREFIRKVMNIGMVMKYHSVDGTLKFVRALSLPCPNWML